MPPQLAAKPPKKRTTYVLDEFSDLNVRQWAAKAAALERYQVELHYSLEAQRKLVRGELYRSLHDSALKDPFDFDHWVRICTYRYSHQPLNAYGSTIGAGGRFNYGDALDNVDAIAFPALYIAENQAVAHREYFGYAPTDKRSLTAEEFALTPKKSVAVVFLNGIIHNVLDITRPAKLKHFVDILAKIKIPKEVDRLAKSAGLTPRDLILTTELMSQSLQEQNWRGWPRQHGLPANCQLFGKVAWEVGFDAILYRSTKGGGRCLAVFPQNLDKSDSRIWLHDTPPPNVIDALDASNWQMATVPG